MMHIELAVAHLDKSIITNPVYTHSQHTHDLMVRMQQTAAELKLAIQQDYRDGLKQNGYT